MTLKRTHGADQIDALSVASEFLMGAVRAIAQGYEPNSIEVQRSLKWAQSKIEECLASAQDSAALTVED